ncbi:MAG TPA: efflux RND transporter periplasmic adaptor subunit [Polyangiales bacterium]|nr:efflux RND transporter periplasmic adaptor subunit [Polyangiales bacterium]
MRTLGLIGLVLCSIACHDDPEPVEQQERAPEAQSNEVQLSQRAVERAGIRLGVVELRALSGGALIPAEVQSEPGSTALVRPLAAGRITRVAVTLGQEVRRGQLLGMVASGDVSSVRSRLDQARARLTAAEATLRRQQQLAKEGIGAQRALIEAETVASELRAEVEGAQRQLSVFGSGAAGELPLASPIDGVVVALHGTLGETVLADQALFSVTDPKRVWVRGDVSELELARLQLGAAVVLRLHAYPDAALPGSISYIAPALDERTRALPIRVTLATPDARLRSGLFGSLELQGGPGDQRVPVVPVDAVSTLDGQSVVFLPGKQPNAFRAQPVALGRRAGSVIEVTSGVAVGERLAVSGTFTLKSVLRSGELEDESGE